MRQAIETVAVAVIGGGPVGLATAAHLIARGVAVQLYEAGPSVGTHVRDALGVTCGLCHALALLRR